MADKKFGDKISKQDFDKMKKAHQEKHPGRTQHVVFSTESLKTLMDKSEFVQVHFVVDDAGLETVSFVGVDAAGKATGEPPVNRGQPCPPYCV